MEGLRTCPRFSLSAMVPFKTSCEPDECRTRVRFAAESFTTITDECWDTDLSHRSSSAARFCPNSARWHMCRSCKAVMSVLITGPFCVPGDKATG